jgi:DNA ligase-1
MQNVRVEYKLDGTRVQLHLDRNKIIKNTNVVQEALFDQPSSNFLTKTYTRNLNETTHQFPDIITAVDEQIDADSVILDGEAIGYDKTTGEYLQFAQTIQRKRKHNVAELASQIPLKYIVFDILYYNGKSLMEKPLSERRAILEEIIKPGEIIEPSKYIETAKPQDIADFFETAMQKKLEGIVVKNPTAPYQAGARSYAWVKYKRSDEKLLEDSIDCVVLGYYNGKGQRAEIGVGGILVGTLDHETQTYKTLTKIGTGLTEDDFRHIREELGTISLKEKPANYEVSKIHEADVWVKPQMIVEVGADEITPSTEHTAGYALRFPRLLKFREDKNNKNTTTIKEIIDLHKRQKHGYY